MLVKLLLLTLAPFLMYGQGVYERGTFVTYPSGKHVNYIHEAAWKTYFAVEDGVLIYDHHNEVWMEPITASNGLIQYPALLVWQDPGTQDVWIVTPDHVFLYDPAVGWMTKALLPRDAAFVGRYSLGISSSKVIITASGCSNYGQHSAIYFRSSGVFDVWGPNESLEVEWDEVEYLKDLDPGIDTRSGLAVELIENGGFDGDGNIRLDGYPQLSVAEVSALSTAKLTESYLGTQGLGVFMKGPADPHWRHRPFGLLSPDVMSLHRTEDTLWVGGRAGLTRLYEFQPQYEEAITHSVFDYSFVSAIETTPTDVFIAGREGVFKRGRTKTTWDRLIKKEDMKSKQIYALAAGLDGNLMIATEENAFLYHQNGLIMNSLFPKNSRWSVYDVKYSEGVYYLATALGLYIYSEEYQAFTARISSQGEIQSPQVKPALDPFYGVSVSDSSFWSTTSRGLVNVDLKKQTGSAYLTPDTPFKPRGIILHGPSVWVGTDHGLYSFTPKDGAWRLYTRADGLVSNFITDLVAKGEYIWAGSNLGLTRITWKNL